MIIHNTKGKIQTCAHSALCLYLFHAVALSLITEGRQADQMSLLHLSISLVVSCLIPSGGHQVNCNL